MASNSSIVIAGAGMNGMMAALLLSRHVSPERIVIIDTASVPGGNYRCVDYKDGSFDQGMRMLYETGDAEFDALIRGILPESEWHVLPGNTKDIAGIYWNGKLQTNSAYLDLRRLSDYAACKAEVLAAIAAGRAPDLANAQAWLTGRYGPKVAGYLGAALEKLFALPASKLDLVATHQPAMNRVILFGEKELQPLLKQDALRERVAWPDQLTLPALRPFNQAALYPKQYGMNRVIDALQAQLKKAGVRFLYQDAITAIERKGESITAIRTKNNADLGEVERCYWTGSMPALAKLLDAKPQGAPMPPLPPSALVHLALPEPPDMGRLYHFYCFDKGFKTFRLTHYANYCAAAKRKEGYPVCMELWHLPSDEALIVRTAREELEAFGIARGAKNIYVYGVTHTPNLHAHCSLEAMDATRRLRHALRERTPRNLTLLGAFAEEGQWLLYEVWRDMVRKIRENDGYGRASS